MQVTNAGGVDAMHQKQYGFKFKNIMRENEIKTNLFDIFKSKAIRCYF